VKRVVLLSLFGFGALAVALQLNRELDRAVDAEPAWFALRVQNASEANVQILGLAVAPGTVSRGPEHAVQATWPSLSAASDGSEAAWIAGRYRIDGTNSIVELTLQRLGSASPETHRINIEARAGGMCSVVIAIGSDGIRADTCRDWTPTYGGAPH
jgi:hypothetical protein